MQSNNDASPDLEIRFTGGWVRDKLLGLESSDIDVALSTMTGFQFGIALQDFVSRKGGPFQGEARKLNVPSAWKDLHKIEANPEKSKHLETVTTRIFGLDVDLVNLRKEVYTENNRNPQMEFGTAEEDALRRDATVNALFYNLHQEGVEDLTGKGLDDMTKGIIRTPLEPHQTFTDDPLRVLRLIRFASRLGYSIEESAKKSMADPEIHKSLRIMISRERVGVEVGKMMNGPHPLIAMDLIHELNLYSTIFLDPKGQTYEKVSSLSPGSESAEEFSNSFPRSYYTLAELLNTSSSIAEVLIQGNEETGDIYWTLSAYAPLENLKEASENEGRGQGSRSKLEWAVKDAREGIKATNKVSRILEDSIRHYNDIRQMTRLVVKEELNRSTIGMAIRAWGASWRLQVLYALLAEVSCLPSENEEPLQRYTKFVKWVRQHELLDAAVLKPILNGEDIKVLFELKKSGPFMRNAIDAVAEWQYGHAMGSKDEAKEWLFSRREALGIPS